MSGKNWGLEEVNITSKSFQAKTSRGEATRQKLLAAAEEIFGTKGYFRTSVVDITLKAGVAQGTFYVYFPGKKDIFEELVKELSHNLRQEISQAVTSVKNRMEAEERGLAAFFAFIKEHRNLYRIVQEAQFVDEELYKWYYRRFAQGYIKGLEGAMASGEFRNLDAETVAYALIGMAEFLGRRWVLWEEREMPQEALETALTLAMQGLLPRVKS
ncbi:TetR/AcrR family transcriptional regulator [Paradesulfitobacterium ferrireducens]|uniref:TetR/AcrR family transcriptional regulator n=1 Tax=Paradesulfitobacterium ferrireducens TaxID=2816476 RepID=UPI001A8EE703|nr:TetR/AcrR family transcriptional regulator [Paradesulfitobacterium ferrireducens]